MNTPSCRRIVTFVAVAVVALLGCDPAEDAAGARRPNGAGGTENAANEPVCGLVDLELVQQISEDKEIDTTGRGILDKSARAAQPAQCEVQADGTTVLQVSIGEVEDRAYWRDQLEREAADTPTSTTYTGDPGVGWGRTYDRGAFVDGAGVSVLRGARLIRVTVHHWPGVTPTERLTLAEKIVRDVDENVTVYDQQHPG